MTFNPYKDSTKTAKRINGTFSLDVAEVTAVEDDAAHQVLVQVLSADTGAERDLQGGPIPASVSVTGRGDINVPREGDVVIIGRFRNRRPVVLGVVYTRQNAPTSYSAEERHIGSDSSEGLFLHGPFGAVPKVTADPSDPPSGAVWYRDDLGEYRGVEDGTIVTFNTTAV